MPIDSPIEEIKERLSIVDVVSTRVPLKKAGRTFKGLCPFHNEKTPSFVVFPDKGNYHCFGCGANGDVFTFLMKTENLDFPQALQALAERAGVTLRPSRPEAKEDRRRGRLLEINLTAAQFYHNLLRQGAGRQGLEYLRRRGLADETAAAYQLGWAPDAYDLLLRYLISRGIDQAEVVEAGLAMERDGSFRDLLRARVTFPIRDERGNVVGFGARTLGDGQPKYLNTPTTPVFDKGSSLYGIDVARSAIREEGRAVIVEGYMDVLTAHQSGIKNVTASLGTALTDRQVTLLKRYTHHVVLALDPDAAGQAAALRGLEVARQVYGNVVPVPQPNGLIRLEQRLDGDIRIAALPPGKDPDEVIRRDPDEWRRLIANAKPTVDFYFDVVLSKADLESAKGTSEAVQQLLPIVGELPDRVQQSYYLRRLATIAGVSDQILASELSRRRVRQTGPRPPAPRAPRVELVRARARPGAVHDQYYVELILQYYQKTGKLPAGLNVDDMGTTEGREVLAWLRRRVEAGALDLAALAETPPDDLAEPLAEWLLERLRGTHGAGLLYEGDLNREIEACTREILRRNLRWKSEDLAELMRQAAEESQAPVATQRNLVEAAEVLLTQLQPYELNSTRSSVWRRSPGEGGEPERHAEDSGNP